LAIPKNAFVNSKSPRYRADPLLKILKSNQPDSIDFNIGLFNKNISPIKRDEFVNTLKPKESMPIGAYLV